MADGNYVTHSKPDPEGFLLAARMLELPPAECLAVEDAKASIKDAQRGRVDTADIGDAADAPSVTYRLKIVPDLAADLV